MNTKKLPQNQPKKNQTGNAKDKKPRLPGSNSGYSELGDRYDVSLNWLMGVWWV